MSAHKHSNTKNKSFWDRVKTWWNNDTIFLSGVCLLSLVTFLRAFSIDFMLDDYFFLKVGRANSIGDFLHFFYPVKDYFYRPIPTETFYFLIHIFRENTVIAHTMMFILYFVGLVFLYKIILKILHERGLARLFIFLYAIHFTHVFQLYEIATAIEIFLFTFLVISFYYYLNRKIALSVVFFVLALLSKETAILFPLFLLLYYVFKGKKEGFRLRDIFWYVATSVLFGLIYRFGVSEVVRNEPTYRIQKNPRLMVNNLMWYSFWSLGIPNFFPDYFASIFSPPIADFWKQLKNQTFIYWAWSYGAYFVLFIPTAIVGFVLALKKKNGWAILLFSAISFLLFISPTLPILHKWMVRLTLPLIFVVLIQSYLLWLVYASGKLGRIVVGIILVLFFIGNAFAIQLHQESGLFLLETRIVKNVRTYVAKHRKKIEQKGIIHFQDRDVTGVTITPWGGSKKLSTTLHGEDFADLFFPDKSIRVFYAYETPATPEGAFIAKAFQIVQNQSFNCKTILFFQWCW